LYRKFEALNHRILLHLQDEIAEMEEELHGLDAALTQPPIARHSPLNHEADMGTGSPTASRRAEARIGNIGHMRRTELLGRIFIKLGQYNQALASISSATNRFAPASDEEVRSYRAWMDVHSPIDEQERGFLDEEADLICLLRPKAGMSATEMTISKREGQREDGETVPDYHLAAICLVLALGMPILAMVLSMPGAYAVMALVILALASGAGYFVGATAEPKTRYS